VAVAGSRAACAAWQATRPRDRPRLPLCATQKVTEARPVRAPYIPALRLANHYCTHSERDGAQSAARPPSPAQQRRGSRDCRNRRAPRRRLARSRTANPKASQNPGPVAARALARVRRPRGARARASRAQVRRRKRTTRDGRRRSVDIAHSPRIAVRLDRDDRRERSYVRGRRTLLHERRKQCFVNHGAYRSSGRSCSRMIVKSWPE